MLQAPFFFQQAVGTVAPVLSNQALLMRTDSTAWGHSTTGIISFPYTSTSGNVVYLGCTRNNTSVARTLVADWNGGSMLPAIATAKQDLATNLSCQVAIKTAGTVGAGNINLTGSTADNHFVFFLGWAFDLDQVRGGVGGSGASVIAVSQAFVQVSLTVQQVGSLLVAAAWNQDRNLRPFNWSAGWTKLDEQQIGAGNQPTGSVATKTATATGVETVSMTGTSGNASQWAIVVAEFLPG